jgi:hypothetical protein
LFDETCQSQINQGTQKKGIQRTKREGATSKKMKEPPNEGKPPRYIKLPNPLMSQEAYQIMKREDLLKGHLA